MFMKRKIKSDSGFTLAELLIVVAIIGVLVAIAIPIFTGQLEKSREAVDLSDVRSAYAEVMMAAITGDTSAYYTKDGSTIYKSDKNYYQIIVNPLKQQKPGWDTPRPITIGGVSSTDTTHWQGDPGAGGSCEITYWPDSDSVTFVWSDGTSGGGGNTGGENNGGDNNADAGGNSGTSSDPAGNVSIIDYPNKPNDNSTYQVYQGYVYRDKATGNLYIASTTPDKPFDQYYWRFPGGPESDWVFVRPTNKIFTSKNEIDNGKGEKDIDQAINRGDIYVNDSGQKYLCLHYSNPGQSPVYDDDVSHWIKIVGNYPLS